MGHNQYTEHSLLHLHAPSVCGIYMLTDIYSGKTYIGASINIRLRVGQHFSEMKNKRRNGDVYNNFRITYNIFGPKGFALKIFLICKESELYEYEKKAIEVYAPTENSHSRADDKIGFTEKECRNHSQRTKALWTDPVYRARAIAARVGKATNKGYKCTPEQVENRRKAGRISNMKRWYGEQWKLEYINRYPEFIGDLDGT